MQNLKFAVFTDIHLSEVYQPNIIAGSHQYCQE